MTEEGGDSIVMVKRIAFLGGARYDQPLDTTSQKKFQRLSDLGEIFVIGFSKDMAFRWFTEYAHFYLLPNWPFPMLRHLTFLSVGPLLALWLIFRHKVNILVAQSPYEGTAAAIAKSVAGWFCYKMALVIESHSDFEKDFFLQRNVRLSSIYRYLMRRAASFSLRRADVLRAISKPTREQLVKWAPGRPVFQFPAWTDMEAFWAAGEKVKEGKVSTDIVYVGVLIPRKGVHFLINAFTKVATEFPDAHLSIIGKADDVRYARALKAQAHSLGLTKRVIFLDAMPQLELAERMAKGIVLVLPSLSEGLGRVVFEAMAAGTPVIGSNVGGIPEMIQDGVTGFLIPPGDVDALTDRLRWVLRHPKESLEMGQKAREFARNFFSPNAYFDGYAQLFEAAVRSLKRE